MGLTVERGFLSQTLRLFRRKSNESTAVPTEADRWERLVQKKLAQTTIPVPRYITTDFNLRLKYYITIDPRKEPFTVIFFDSFDYINFKGPDDGVQRYAVVLHPEAPIRVATEHFEPERKYEWTTDLNPIIFPMQPHLLKQSMELLSNSIPCEPGARNWYGGFPDTEAVLRALEPTPVSM